MPELKKEMTALGMDRIGDFAPACHLGIGEDARRPRIAFALGGNLGRFGDNQPRRGPLRVVGDGQLIRHVAVHRPVAGQGSHDHAVRQRDRPECGGRK